MTRHGGTFSIDDTEADRLDWLLRLDIEYERVRRVTQPQAPRPI